MTSTRWSTIRQLFHELVDLPPAEWSAMLHCRTRDITLIREVQHLLDLHLQSNGLLDESLPEARRLHQALEGPSLSSGMLLAGRFEIGNMLGFGGMGEVYEAFDRELNRRVAVKILRAEYQQDSNRLSQEVKTATLVTHPNVCRVFDIGRDGQILFITMELLAGETLAVRLREGPLPRIEMAVFAEQVTLGLQAAHDKGVVHRDLKPANVMRVSSSHFVIMDFGLAQSLEPGSVPAGQILAGTLGYLAPEVLSGRPHTVASDLYSLGILLHEAATGHLPFDRLPGRTDQPAMDGALSSIIDDCLQPDPLRRPASVAEIRRRLSPVAKTRRWWLVAAAAGTATTSLALFSGGLRFISRSPGFGPIDAVLVTPIRNTTDNSRLDGVTTLLSGQLAQSPQFALLSSERRRELLARMQRSAASPLTAPIAREIALRNGRTLVVYGQVSLIGPDYLLDVKLEYPGSRPDYVDASADRRFRAGGSDELLERIRSAALWIREVAGESAGDRGTHNRPPSEITTPSWDALAFYDQAKNLRSLGRIQEASGLLREAIRLDAGFASAHRELADLLFADDRLKEAYASWLAAVEASRQRQLNSRERFQLEAAYYDDIGDLKRGEEINILWTAAYARDYLPRFYLGNICLRQYRELEGLKFMRQAAERDSNLAVLSHLIRHLAVQSRFSEAESQIAELEKRGFSSDALALRGMLCCVSGQFPAALRFLQEAATLDGDIERKHYDRLAAASVLTEMGRELEAERSLISWSAEDEAAGAPQRQGDKLAVAAYLALRRGDHPSAHARASEALAKAGPLNENAALVLARLGAAAETAKVLKALRELPDLPRFARVRERISGEFLLAQGRFGQALEALRRAESMTTAWFLNDSLARALARSGRSEDSIAAYRVLLARRSLCWYLPGLLAPGLTADALRGASG